MVDSKELKSMKSSSGKLTVTGFSCALQRVREGQVEKRACLPPPGAGLRFQLVSPGRFEPLSVKSPDALPEPTFALERGQVVS